jgi:nucleoside-diphosphate-sugar epimerase
MRVFVTGASGFIGSAIVQELMEAGHEVLGLARSDQAADAIANAGAQVHRGSLQDLASLRGGAAESDGVIHTAYIHDFSQIEAAAQTDLRAIETLGAALAGSDRPLVITTGIGAPRPGHVATEDDCVDPGSAAHPRMAAEHAVRAFVSQGVRGSIVRPGRSVHGDGDHGFLSVLIDIARRKRLSGYVGDGSARWPAVHRLDAAHLYRLALEKAPAGSVAHAVADEGVPTREIAEVIGRRLQLPVGSIAPRDAAEHFGWMGAFFALDAPASSALTRERLGWRPTHPGLIEDLDRARYFTRSALVPE